MALAAPKRPYTDEQMRQRLKRLTSEQQYEFLRCSEALFAQESDQYLSALADSRMAFADAMAKVRDELRSDSEEDEEGESKNQEKQGTISENLSSVFDTSTEIGQSMATIGTAFSGLLQTTKAGEPEILELVKEAEKKAMAKYLKEVNVAGSLDDKENEMDE